MSSFVHLHNHSQYSILDATLSTKQLIKACKKEGMQALSLTDHGNLFGAIEFYKECLEEKIQPIIGCEIYVAYGSCKEKSKLPGKPAAHPIVLLAKNKIGYQNLCKLVSIGYLEGFYYYPRIDHDLLAEYKEGLICLTGTVNSLLGQEIVEDKDVKATLQFYQDLFQDDLYFSLQRHEMTEEEKEEDSFFQESWLVHQYEDYIAKQKKIEKALLSLSLDYQIPLVATNDVHYLKRKDWKDQEILINIQSGEPCEIWERDSFGKPFRKMLNPRRRTYPSHKLYFRSCQEMEALFSELPEAIQNTLLIANKCKLSLDLNDKHYPVYLPPGFQDKKLSSEERQEIVEKFLWKLCEEGIQKRYTEENLLHVEKNYPGQDPLEVVRARLHDEMGVIVPKGMCDYLLIVWDFIHWAKQNSIPVGPGRGSGAGSIVLYLIGVTDIEPLRFHLFFERFINPERISYPDIDVDICMERRQEVIAYTLQKYGKENVAQIITFGTMKAKMAIKDVGRVLDVPLSKVNEIAKLIPEDLSITIEKALQIDADLQEMVEKDEEVKKVIKFAKKLEGSIRNTGIHAAGIIICGDPLTEHIPLCITKDLDIPVTQYSMKPVELVGMLKIDFLGLKTLTAIQFCVDAIQKTRGERIDWVNLPLDDKSTFSLLNQGKTAGIFQLESGGMQDLARQLHLDKFEEIIAVNALYRPGPMDMIPSFIQRKHGKEEIIYDHPWMEDILAETYGVMVYQEQVMQIASKLAGYTLGEGDILRKAMGKKDHKQMAAQREKFLLGSKKNNIQEETAIEIFDKIEKFAAYGFNKSHAAAYGFLSYVTAYFKANFPKEWMAALMTCDRDDLAKITKIIRECQSMQIKILPPDVNEAESVFFAAKEGIRFALAGIKGVGAGIVETIIQEREKNGPFKNFYDFFERIDLQKIGKKTIEYLVDAGGFDFTNWTRNQLKEMIEPMHESALKEQQEKKKGILSLFSSLEPTHTRFQNPQTPKNPLSRQEILLKEKELLGFFLTGHPMDEYSQVLQTLSCISLRRLEENNQEGVYRSAFIIEGIKVRMTQKTLKKFAILTISDGLVQKELPVWPDLYEEKQQILSENKILVAVLSVEKKEEGDKLSCRWFDLLSNMDEKMMLESDKAYDQAKLFFDKGFHRNQKKEKTSFKEKKEEGVKKEISIHLDFEKIRLSHFLKMKEILLKCPKGNTSLVFDFFEQKKKVAKLSFSPLESIEWTEEVRKALEEIESIYHFEMLDNRQ